MFHRREAPDESALCEGAPLLDTHVTIRDTAYDLKWKANPTASLPEEISLFLLQNPREHRAAAKPWQLPCALSSKQGEVVTDREQLHSHGGNNYVCYI